MARLKPQVIVVGSGINSLVCAAVLATRGKSVLVLERNSTLGGCIRTEELFPGYHHDILSSWYPLFVGSHGYAELKPALQRAGLEWFFRFLMEPKRLFRRYFVTDTRFAWLFARELISAKLTGPSKV